MARRSLLHQTLKGLFVHIEPHVYYNPPESVKLIYPCIVYKFSDFPDGYADNIPYFEYRSYQVTVIDPDPDSKLRDKVARLKWCRYVRDYISDNLNHYVFELNY